MLRTIVTSPVCSIFLRSTNPPVRFESSTSAETRAPGFTLSSASDGPCHALDVCGVHLRQLCQLVESGRDGVGDVTFPYELATRDHSAVGAVAGPCSAD